MELRIIIGSIFTICSIWFLIWITLKFRTAKRVYLLSNNICPYCEQPFQKCVVWDNNQWEASLMCPELHCGLIFYMPMGRTMKSFSADDPTSPSEVTDYSISTMKYKLLDGLGTQMKLENILWA